jgi:glycerophosphoryl diester phosphodiesterase
MEARVIVYDKPEVLALIRKAGDDSVATMTKLRPRIMDFDRFVKVVSPSAVEIDADDVTADVCRAFHVRGIKVQAKTDYPLRVRRAIELESAR